MISYSNLFIFSYDIYGKKIFKGNLTVNKANVNYLEDINAKEVLTIDSREILGRHVEESKPLIIRLISNFQGRSNLST